MPERAKSLTGLVEEARETIKLLESFLRSGSRLDFVQSKAEELTAALLDALKDPELPDEIRSELSEMLERAKSITETARRMAEEVSSGWRDVERRSAEGLRRTY